MLFLTSGGANVYLPCWRFAAHSPREL